MALEELLARAVAAPRDVRPCDQGALVSLALHCLMVQGGFIALDGKGRAQLSSSGLATRPAADWNSRTNEWVFYYARRGAANRFRLHCAALPAGGRMFVHASELTWDDEAPLEGKIAVLGLQLDNYVADAAAVAGAASWQGVVAQQDKLEQMLREHVLTPLTQKAEPSPAGPGSLPRGVLPWSYCLVHGDWAAVLQSAGESLQRGASRCRDAVRGQEAALLAGAGVGLAAAALAAVVLRARAAAQ